MAKHFKDGIYVFEKEGSSIQHIVVKTGKEYVWGKFSLLTGEMIEKKKSTKGKADRLISKILSKGFTIKE
jgi:hypothetical protein